MASYISPRDLSVEVREGLDEAIKSAHDQYTRYLGAVPASVEQFLAFSSPERVGFTFRMLQSFAPVNWHRSDFPDEPVECDITDILTDDYASGGERIFVQGAYIPQKTAGVSGHYYGVLRYPSISLKIGRSREGVTKTSQRTIDIYSHVIAGEETSYKRRPILGEKYYIKKKVEYSDPVDEELDFDDPKYHELLQIIDTLGAKILSDNIIPLRTALGITACALTFDEYFRGQVLVD